MKNEYEYDRDGNKLQNISIMREVAHICNNELVTMYPSIGGTKLIIPKECINGYTINIKRLIEYLQNNNIVYIEYDMENTLLNNKK